MDRSPISPTLALAHIASLSVDVRAAAVVARSGGELLAGDAALLPAAARALAAAPSAPGRALREGDTLAVADDRHAIVARTGPQALDALLAVDLADALADLRAR